MPNPPARVTFNPNINPQFNPNINPKANVSVNPMFDPWINPQRNTENQSFLGSALHDLTQSHGQLFARP